MVLADTTGDTFTMDPEKLEGKITPRTRVIIPVHLFGHPADMDPICEIAERHGLTVLEGLRPGRGRRVQRPTDRKLRASRVL